MVQISRVFKIPDNAWIPMLCFQGLKCLDVWILRACKCLIHFWPWKPNLNTTTALVGTVESEGGDFFSYSTLHIKIYSYWVGFARYLAIWYSHHIFSTITIIFIYIYIYTLTLFCQVLGRNLWLLVSCRSFSIWLQSLCGKELELWPSANLHMQNICRKYLLYTMWKWSRNRTFFCQ